MGELGRTDMIDSILATGTKYEYVFETSYGTQTSEFLWFAVASPAEPGDSGERYFCVNHEGVTFYRLDRPFKLNSLDCPVPADAKPVGR